MRPNIRSKDLDEIYLCRDLLLSVCALKMDERKYGIHGGDVETSLMLNFKPNSVDMSKAENFVSSAEEDLVPPVGPISRGWIASDLNPDGTVGNANLATARKGLLTTKHQVTGFIDLLRKVRDMPLPSAKTKL